MKMTDDAASMTRAERRLAQLDREWDVDRALMAALGTVGTFVAVRAALGVRATGGLNGWLYAVRVPFAFLLMQAVAGWSPPVAVLRRLGFRTRMEIDAERSALEVLVQQPRGTIAPSTDVWPASDA